MWLDFIKLIVIYIEFNLIEKKKKLKLIGSVNLIDKFHYIVYQNLILFLR